MDRDEIFFEPVNFLEENSFIAACSSRATKEHEVIFNQGASSSDLYVIKSGSFVVSDSRGNKELVLAALNRGDVFGEMAFFRSGIRSAAVTCVTPGEVLSISRKSFREFHENYPDLAIRVTCTLAGMLSDRLKHADATLSLLSDDSDLRQRYEIRRLIKELKVSIQK